jgi:hypothetical protein
MQAILSSAHFNIRVLLIIFDELAGNGFLNLGGA